MQTEITAFRPVVEPHNPVLIERRDVPLSSASLGAFAVADEARRVQSELDADSLISEAEELRALIEQTPTKRTPVYGLSPAAFRYRAGLRTGASMTANEYARVKDPFRQPGHLDSGAEHMVKEAADHREKKSDGLMYVRSTLHSLDAQQRSTLDEYFNGSVPAFLKAQQEKADATDWAAWLVGGASDETLMNVLQWHDDVVRKAREKLEPFIDQARHSSFDYAMGQYKSGRYAKPPQSLNETVYDVQDLFQTTLIGRGGFSRDDYIAVAQDAIGEQLRDILSHENMHMMYSSNGVPRWFEEAMTENESLRLNYGINYDTIGTYVIERMLLRNIIGDEDGDLARLALRAHTGGEEHLQEFKVAFDVQYKTEDGFDKLQVAIDSRRTQIRDVYKQLRQFGVSIEGNVEAAGRIRVIPLLDVMKLIDQRGMSAGLREAIAAVPAPTSEPIGS